MFLETPVIFVPVNFPGNLPGNLREVVTSRKVTGESQILQNQTKWRPGGGLFCLVQRPRSYQKRPDMADCEVIECSYRLSRARIEWLVEELKDELERISARSCPLSPETQVDIIVVAILYAV